MPGPRARGRRGRAGPGCGGVVRSRAGQGQDEAAPGRQPGPGGAGLGPACPSRRPASWQEAPGQTGLGSGPRAGCGREGGGLEGRGGGAGRGWGEGRPAGGSRRAGDREYGPRGPGVAAGAQPATPARPPLCRGRDPVGWPRMRRAATLGGGVRAAGLPVWSRRARPPPPAPSVLNDASPGRVPTGRLRAGSVVRRPFLKPPAGLGGQR